VLREPCGVIGVISPWNYPFILAMDPVATALFAGNGVVLKPSEFTPYSGLFIEELVREIDGQGRSVCDLCFGDLYVARWCRANGFEWIGVELNPGFCRQARRAGFSVLEGDVLEVDLPKADVYVMAGSLYHFHDRLSELFDAIFRCTSRFILSEPVDNLSNRSGLIGRLARRSGNPGSRPASFRYDEQALLDALDEQKRRIGLHLRLISRGRDLLVQATRR
jgi:hypothetical protein